MSYPNKGSILIATGNGNFKVIQPATNNEVLVVDFSNSDNVSFKSLSSLMPRQFFKVIATNKDNTNSKNYQTLGLLTLPSSSEIIIQNIKVVSYSDGKDSSYDVRIYDTTNNKIIAEETFKNEKSQVNVFSNLNNLPENEAIVEIQFRRSNGGKRVYFNEATFEFIAK